jgi:hypothetical protein
MTRLRRIVAVNVPHHLTQRGNARQHILNRDEDRAVYLKLLRENIEGGMGGMGDGLICAVFFHNPNKPTQINHAYSGCPSSSQSNLPKSIFRQTVTATNPLMSDPAIFRHLAT